jgi:hypothetical protein
VNVRRTWSHALLVAALGAASVATLAGSGAGCATGAISAGSSESRTSPQGASSSSTSSVTATSSADAAGGVSGIAATPYGKPLIGNPSLCTAGQTSVGLAPLRRISRLEYDDMVRDLLGDTTQPALQFEAESPMANGVNFYVNTYTYVTSPVIPQQYLQAAESLAATAVSGNALTNLLNGVPNGACSLELSGSNATLTTAQYATCAQAFIDYFANKAFRGQYDSTESADLFAIYSNIESQFSFATGLQAVITTVLTSPRFLFVLEFGAANPTGTVVLLAPDELATRLSMFLWRSLPDDTLLTAASNGGLSTPDQIQAQAVRMLADPKALAALQDFATQWMELEGTASATKDTQFTKWSAQLASEMQQETTTTFASEVVSENGGTGGTLNELLTSGESYINSDLASFYGVGGGSSTYVKTNVNPNPANPQRAGILTNASVLATQAHTSLPSPVLRGKLVREQVLCDPVPPPPAGINIPPPPASVPAGSTTRSQFEEHSTNPLCASCHDFMDPIGYGFGNFDATGAYQSTDANGEPDAGGYPPIDASGTVQAAASPLQPSSTETTLQVNGAVDLATKLAGTTDAAECFALEEFRYALGRVEVAADACSVQQVYQSFTSNNQNLQSVLIAIVRSDSFRYRNVETAGSECQ